jgi:hypothetical protein
MLFINPGFVVVWRLAAIVSALLVSAMGLLAFTAIPASAASGDHFSCRASALRVEGLGVLDAEPAVANSANDPCSSNHAAIASVAISTVLTTGVASATTTSAASSGSASADVANPIVLATTLDLSADVATASASYRCSAGTPTRQSSSTVVNLRIGGGAPITTSGPVSIPGGVADVELNRTLTTATSLTRRAVDITVLGPGGAHIVLGEATAGISGNPCETGTSGLGQPVIQSGPPASSSSTSATFVYISRTPGVTFECRLDNGPFRPCNGTTRLTGLSAGRHTFYMRAVVNGVVGPIRSFSWNVSNAAWPKNRAQPAISGTAKAGKTLSCSTGTWINHPTRFAYSWTRDGTPIAGATHRTYKVKTGDDGLTVTCTVTAFNRKGLRRATSRRVSVAVPFVLGCPRATGHLSGRTLGPVRLGMTRAQARRAFTHRSNRGKRWQDFLTCLTRVGMRVGYASNQLLRTLSPSQRNRVRGRVVLALTASRSYALRGIRPGATLAAAHRRLGTGAPLHIGLNYWYMAPNGTSTAVLKVRHGTVQEVGIADAQLTKGRKAQLTFMRSFG